MPDRQEVTLALTWAGLLAGLFHSELPSLYQLRTDGDPDQQLRQAEGQVVGMAVIGGVGLAALTKSWWPFYASAIVAGIFLAQYEVAVRGGNGPSPHEETF